jgi:hypothetical protein
MPVCQKNKIRGTHLEKSAGGVGSIEKVRKGLLYQKSSLKAGNDYSISKAFLVPTTGRRPISMVVSNFAWRLGGWPDFRRRAQLFKILGYGAR